MVLLPIRKHWSVMVKGMRRPAVLIVALLVASSTLPAAAIHQLIVLLGPMDLLTQIILGIFVFYLLAIFIAVVRSISISGAWIVSLPALVVVLYAIDRVFASAPSAIRVLPVAILASTIAVELLWALLYWRTQKVIVTNQRVIVHKGVLSTYSSIIPIGSIQNVAVRQTSLGRLLDYGNLEIETAGPTSIEPISSLPHPLLVSSNLFQVLRSP
jgi:membrane protein YdbS with pleckstrin-like domain